MKANRRGDGGETSGEVEALGATHLVVSCAGEEGGWFIRWAIELHFERRQIAACGRRSSLPV